MVHSTHSNDPPSSPTRASMEITSFNVIPQQSPQTTPSHDANVDERVGATFPAMYHQPFPLQPRWLQRLHNLTRILLIR